MGITNGGRSAQRQSRALKLKRRHHRGFNMQMPINKARGHKSPLAINDFSRNTIRIVHADAHDVFATNGDASRIDLTRDHIKQLNIFNQDIKRGIAASLRQAIR
ncbi:hypothetical protein D3C72_1414990 [compost metagenome]